MFGCLRDDGQRQFGDLIDLPIESAKDPLAKGDLVPEKDLPDPLFFLEIIATKPVERNTLKLSVDEKRWLPRDLAAYLVAQGQVEPYFFLASHPRELSLNREPIGDSFRRYLTHYPGLAGYAERVNKNVVGSGKIDLAGYSRDFDWQDVVSNAQPIDGSRLKRYLPIKVQSMGSLVRLRHDGFHDGLATLENDCFRLLQYIATRHFLNHLKTGELLATGRRADRPFSGAFDDVHESWWQGKGFLDLEFGTLAERISRRDKDGDIRFTSINVEPSDKLKKALNRPSTLKEPTANRSRRGRRTYKKEIIEALVEVRSDNNLRGNLTKKELYQLVQQRAQSRLGLSTTQGLAIETIRKIVREHDKSDE